mmetsp:Transcript_67366/g.213240  ORF Transcript_67366/g.213240 Transcript_67366/m.213240 type:complete len:316 (-) Transcript_67366:178-1125(-)
MSVDNVMETGVDTVASERERRQLRAALDDLESVLRSRDHDAPVRVLGVTAGPALVRAAGAACAICCLGLAALLAVDLGGLADHVPSLGYVQASVSAQFAQAATQTHGAMATVLGHVEEVNMTLSRQLSGHEADVESNRAEAAGLVEHAHEMILEVQQQQLVQYNLTRDALAAGNRSIELGALAVENQNKKILPNVASFRNTAIDRFNDIDRRNREADASLHSMYTEVGNITDSLLEAHAALDGLALDLKAIHNLTSAAGEAEVEAEEGGVVRRSAREGSDTDGGAAGRLRARRVELGAMMARLAAGLDAVEEALG